MPSPDSFVTTNVMQRRRTYTVSNGSWSTYTDLGSTQTFARSQVTTSVKTPNFGKMKKSALPINTYNKNIGVRSDPIIHDWVVKAVPVNNPAGEVHYHYEVRSAYAGYDIDFVDIVGDLTPLVTARLLAKLSEGKTNTMVTAAEMHKTTAHLAKTAGRLYGAVKALKHGDFGGFTTELGITSTTYQRRRFDRRYRKAKRFADEKMYSSRTMMFEAQKSRMSSFFSETWLEYSYGWKPLLFDVYSHAQALAELSIERQNVIRFVKARAEINRVSNETGGSTDIVTYTRRRDVTKWCEIGVGYKLQGNELNTFSQLGIDNPMEVAWELIPFSFVADWFIPVGNFLRSLTATTGLVFVKGYKTTRHYHVNDTTLQGNGKTVTSGGVKYSTLSGSGGAHGESFDITRTILYSFPTPSFPSFKDPRSGDDYGLKRALSAVSLLQSLFLKQKSSGSKYL